MSDWLTQHLRSPVPADRDLPGGESRRLLVEGAGALGITLTSDQIIQLLKYLSELIRWNPQLKLTRLQQEREILVEYFLEALSGLRALGEKVGPGVDLGSGAGFPGLVMKIARPSLKITLVEADGKRVSFLHQVIGLLKLTGIPVFRAPFEQLAGSEWEERFDFLITRSLPPEQVIEKGRRFLRLGGRALFFQIDVKEEEWRGRLGSYTGMELEKVEAVKLTANPNARSIIFVKQLLLIPKPPPVESKPLEELPVEPTSLDKKPIEQKPIDPKPAEPNRSNEALSPSPIMKEAPSNQE